MRAHISLQPCIGSGVPETGRKHDVLGRRWFQTLLTAVLDVQILILRTSFTLHHVNARRQRPSGYVVGMEEIAGLLTAMAASLDDVTTVNLTSNPLYDNRYDVEFDLGGRWSFVKRLRRLVLGPWVMGRLAAQRRTFVYLGAQGFLISLVDGRDREFAFLRQRGRIVVCYFTGSDIRSYELLNEFGRTLGRDVLTTYEPQVSPGIDSAAAEEHRRNLAAAADRHAHIIFNAPVEQMSYLERPTEPALYFFPDECIARRPEKWRDISRPVIVHAPSVPFIKGTPLVQAAIVTLQEGGYDFEYVEMTGRPNAEVLAALERAHVVLGHFYQFNPGIIGIEAMAANAVLMSSGDPEIERSLPPDAKNAWVVTPYWQLLKNLQGLLDNPERMQSQADRGTAWVEMYCSRSVDRARLLTLLASIDP